ncbi:hypothetical protein LAZ67_6004033 [Cordylochernes scorpioides]|uniref:Uncharacterized protein n=1 Tax=Cordylochernes scorpioides TaxID=51811 RepID=A0ABY6KL77_9ARAC|nr:hypothetical protein LAZ67_6004033 [Cordylochernes scorpioides]
MEYKRCSSCIPGSGALTGRDYRHVTCMTLIEREATSRALRQEVDTFESQKVSERQFDDDYRSMDCQLEDHGFGYL